MFAKLKKKIVEEEGVGEGDLVKKYSAGTISPQHGPLVSRGSTSSLASMGSLSNLNSQATERKKSIDATVVSTLQADLSQRNSHVQRLETRLDEYSAMLKEALKSKEKLEAVLEKQQEANTKRLEELNEEYQTRRAKMADKMAAAIKRKEDEMSGQMETLDREKLDLQAQLQRLSMDKFKKQEESEELQGFQVQELAKVKHMFVNSQEELHKCRADLDHERGRLEETRRQEVKLSGDLVSAQDHVNKLKKTRDELMKQKMSAEEEVSKQERLRKSLEERVNSLTIENQEKSDRLLGLDDRLSSTQEDKDSLRRDNENYRMQAATQLLESENTNRLLQEKLAVLEQRLLDHSLTDDEQIKAIMLERDTLEQRLEESRREVIDAKTSSAETCSSLEQQISHLNAKIAEDRCTLLEKQQSLESAARRHAEETTQLRDKLASAEQQANAHLQLADQRGTHMAVQKSLSETELSAAQEQLIETRRQGLEGKKQLQDKIAALESKLTSLGTAADFDKSASEHRLCRLESQNEEYLEREIESEKRLSCLQEENDSLKSALNAKTQDCQRLTEGRDEDRLRSLELEKQAAAAGSTAKDAQKEVDRLRKLIEDKDVALNQSESESEELKCRCSELNQSLTERDAALKAGHDEAQRAVFDKNETISILKQTVMDREEEGEMSLSKIQDLEARLAAAEAETNGVDDPEDVAKLRGTIEEYEQQLAEKNKTIKMQQQRLGDLKKTLQRELKMQNSSALPGYDSPEELLRDKAPVGSGNTALTVPPLSRGHGGNDSLCNNRGSPLCIPSGYSRADIREVNFQYLRHVIFKFMSSSDNEAKQLLKVVATLLEFTPHEEKLINKTLEWKTSWFGAKPSPKKPTPANSLVYR